MGVRMRKKDNFANGETTVIGAGTVVDGNVSLSASARIDGIINGDVTSKGTLIVGSEGSVNGNITTMDLMVAGNVKGNVTADGKIAMVAKGKLYGDISTKTLTIDESALFQGKCLMDTTVVENKEENQENSKEENQTEA